MRIYRNRTDWYVASSLEEATKIAREWQSEVCGDSLGEIDLNLRELPDDEKIRIYCDPDDMRPSAGGEGHVEEMTAAQLATISSKGFLASTEF